MKEKFFKCFFFTKTKLDGSIFVYGYQNKNKNKKIQKTIHTQIFTIFKNDVFSEKRRQVYKKKLRK